VDGATRPPRRKRPTPERINGRSAAVDLVTHAVLGGLLSVAGGGKFANGAITGAFQYLAKTSGEAGRSASI